MVRGSWVGRRSTIDDTVSDRVQPLRVRPVPEAPARRTGSTSRDTCRHGSARLRRTRHSPCSSGACAWGSHPVRRATACQSPDPPSRPTPLTCPRHAANRPAEQRYDLPSNGASARTGPTGRPPVRSCQEAGTPRNGWAPDPHPFVSQVGLQAQGPRFLPRKSREEEDVRGLRPARSQLQGREAALVLRPGAQLPVQLSHLELAGHPVPESAHLLEALERGCGNRWTRAAPAREPASGRPTATTPAATWSTRASTMSVTLHSVLTARPKPCS